MAQKCAISKVNYNRNGGNYFLEMKYSVYQTAARPKGKLKVQKFEQFSRHEGSVAWSDKTMQSFEIAQILKLETKIF